MQISDRGISYLKCREGVSLVPYRDAVDLPTIGIGHLIRRDDHDLLRICGSKNPKSITMEQAEELLKADIMYTEANLEAKYRGKRKLSQNEIDALLCFAFNIGVTAFNRSTLLDKLNDGEECHHEFIRWVHAGGRVIEGLVAVRVAEQCIFLNIDELKRLPFKLKGSVFSTTGEKRTQELLRAYYGQIN